MDVLVIGGGIAGLSCALRLSGSHDVRVIEKDRALGGLCSSFRYQDLSIPRFCHCLLPSDSAALSLLHESNLEDAARWESVRTSFYSNGKFFDITSPLGLINFGPLPVVDRIRLGLFCLEALLGLPQTHLEEQGAKEWLSSRVGTSVTARFFEPLSWIKYKQSLADISASWLWNRMVSTVRIGDRTGVLGNRLEMIVDKMKERIEEKGGSVATECQATRIDKEEKGLEVQTRRSVGEESIHADVVVACVPTPQLSTLTRSTGLLSGLGFKAIMNACFILSRCLFDHAASIVFAYDDLPFGGLIAHPFDLYGGAPDMALCYVYDYVGSSEALWKAPEPEILKLYSTSLDHIFKGFSSQIEEAYLFREQFASPIFTRGYPSLAALEESLPAGVFLAGSQVMYPQMPTMGSAIESGFQAASRVSHYLQ